MFPRPRYAVCLSRVLGLFSLLSFQFNEWLVTQKPSHCCNHSGRIGQERTRLTLGRGNARLSVWLVQRIPADEALARRYKWRVSGDPRQVMWGPVESERTESMASGCGRTLPEEGQVCRLLRPCSRILIMRSNTTEKHLQVTRTRTSREVGATDTRSQATRARKDHEWARGPQELGAWDCESFRPDNTPSPWTPNQGGRMFRQQN